MYLTLKRTESLQPHQESRREDNLSEPCVCVCVYARVPFHSAVLFLHIFHSISSVDCTAMKLHVTVLMPLHVMHI